MNKKLVPVVITLLLLAGAGYYLKNRQSTTFPSNQTTGQVMNEAVEFAKAIESGKPALCTLTKGSDKMEYMIKGKAMRMNSTTIAQAEDGKTTTTMGHMINDTKYLYMWDDTTKQGSKIAIPTEEETKAMADKAKEYQQELEATPNFASQSDYDNLKNDGYIIDCRPANVDDSVFIPPADINFIDPTQMMKNIPAVGKDGELDMSQIEELQKQYGGISPEDQ